MRMPEIPLAILLAGCSDERNVTYRSPRWRSITGVYVEVVALEVEFSSVAGNLVRTSYKPVRAKSKYSPIEMSQKRR